MKEKYIFISKDAIKHNLSKRICYFKEKFVNFSDVFFSEMITF